MSRWLFPSLPEKLESFSIKIMIDFKTADTKDSAPRQGHTTKFFYLLKKNSYYSPFTLGNGRKIKF
jgi:hypothetical protein